MARRRYTEKALAEQIETINGWLENEGSLNRFEAGGRNGSSAVDEYSVDSDGKRIGSGVRRNVGCGTPRECAEYAETAYSNEYRTIASRELSKLRAAIAEKDEIINELRSDGGDFFYGQGDNND